MLIEQAAYNNSYCKERGQLLLKQRFKIQLRERMNNLN